MIKLLYISSFVPYKQIRHAGGQTFNYYVKNISKDKGIQTKMIGFCRYDDKKYIDEEKENYECHCILTRGTVIHTSCPTNRGELPGLLPRRR